MSRITKAIFSSLVASVILFAAFFFILPWLLLVLAVVVIAVLASVFLRRGSISFTTVRITNTPNGNFIKTVRTVSPTVEHETSGSIGLLERTSDTDITIYPDGTVYEAISEEDSREADKY